MRTLNFMTVMRERKWFPVVHCSLLYVEVMIPAAHLHFTE